MVGSSGIAPHPGPGGGRARVRRFLLASCLGLTALLPVSPLAATDPSAFPAVEVREEGGLYTVTAAFEVSQPALVARAVLTDYERIPRFMPDVKTSIVRERAGARVVVEQEAVASLMMFSKRIYLLLEIEETDAALRFRDAAGRSFAHYQGEWRWSAPAEGRTIVNYRLAARPAFSVPEFLLRRLLGRDARTMIRQLQTEIAARAARRLD